MGAHQIAQLNVARAVAPFEDPRMADSMSRLEEVKALAERSPGFVWRLQGENGNATDLKVGDDPLHPVVSASRRPAARRTATRTPEWWTRNRRREGPR